MSDLTREEAKKWLEEMKKGYMPWSDEVLNAVLDMAISALKGLDLPDNATNEDAFNYMLRQTFPKVIFIRFHNEANLTEGIVMSKEWLSKPYEKGNIDQKK